MAKLNLKDFIELTGKTSITDWVKYNWLGVSYGPGPGPEPEPVPGYFDFTKEDTFNSLVNAPNWDANVEHPDFTLYRRANTFSQQLTSEGTKLFVEDSTKTYRYGLITTGSSTLGNKFSYEVNFKLFCNAVFTESTKRTLLAWYITDNSTSGLRTDVIIDVTDGITSISLSTVTTEGSTSRTTVYTAPIDINVFTKMKLIWDTVNHTLELVLNDNSIGTYPCYQGILSNANIAGTNVTNYKRVTSLTVKSIEIKGV